MRAQEFITESIDADQVLDYVNRLHHDFDIEYSITDHPEWELKMIPLRQLHLDPDGEAQDPYNRVNWVDYDTVRDLIPKIGSVLKSNPIVVDSQGWIIDGNHRAAAAVEAGLDKIPAYVPVKSSVAEGSLNEYRDALYNFVKSKFPTWPEYVLKDFLYAQAKGIRDKEELKDFLDRNQKDFGQVKWRLEKLPIRLDIFTPKTQRMIKQREGGSSNPFQVPRDAERHAQQLKMIQQQGVRTEPIIVAKLSNGYDLIEGWHRTIQHLQQYPEGYTGPAWVAYGATYASDDKPGVPVKQDMTENMSHDQDGRAVAELKSALLAKRDQLQSASDDQVYDIIDKIMKRIARSHSISGQKLHDMWVDKYKQIPDTWIMNENFINFMNKSLGTKVDKPQADPLAHAPDFYKNAPVANAHIRPAFLKALKFGLSVLAKLDAETKQELLAGGEPAICAYIDSVAKRTGATGFREEDVYECQDDLANIFHDPTMHSWVDVLQQDINENFADGKGPGRPGDSQRHGIPKGATMAELEKASHAKGRKGQLARWQLNMRRGKKK